MIRAAAHFLTGFLCAGLLLGLAPDARASSSFSDQVAGLNPYVSFDPAIVLDATGYPVIAVPSVVGISWLYLVHCNDSNCQGGDESVVVLETASSNPPPYFYGPELAIDSSGNPVLAYFAGNEVRLARCGDPDCAAGNTIETVATSVMGLSMALDSFDNPVLTLVSGTSLLLVHCNDASCSGGDESSVTLDSDGSSPALVIDASDNPVVSYRQGLLGLNVVHCSDPDCSGSMSVESPGTYPGTGSDIRLDASGYPVISYVSTGGALGILHCNDPDCADGDDATSIPYSTATPYAGTSLALDLAGNPVVTFFNATKYMTQLLRCGDPACSTDNTLTNLGSAVGYEGLAIDGAGNEVVVYPSGYQELLTLVHCGDSHCASDIDGDGCTDAMELASGVGSEAGGGLRDAKNFWDYFNPTHDGQNRVDDVLAVSQHYGQNMGDAGYSTDYDRTYLGPDPWDLGPPDGMITVADILAAVYQFGHDCS